ncbi:MULTISPECIES: hypothetical protein [Acetobacter]|uniref:Uncharacterized protein n=1 Tax=Acetobacter tropicalis TaxID=104102 RepID=A0A291PKR2_9PROT|nr:MULTISPECIES: hypothetical protein [Acetobacter]ATJ91987.1 hypothetical protein CIW82_16230 [Acetobacter tropicalis]
MLELLLALLSLIIWSSIFIFYFRDPIFSWLDNRFGKDTVFPPADDTADNRAEPTFSTSHAKTPESSEPEKKA